MAETSEERSAARARAQASIDNMENRYDEQQRRSSNRMSGLSDLSSFSSKEGRGAARRPAPPPRLREREPELDPEWQVDEIHHRTNAFGIPKKLPPSQAPKYEWPPRDNEPLAAEPGDEAGDDLPSSLEQASDYGFASGGPTNALGLPVDWAEKRTQRPADQAQTLRFRHSSSEEVPTNALGIPVNWFEQRLAEEEARQQAIQEAPSITQEEIDEIKKNAREEGFQSGYEDGSKKGYDEGFKTGTAQGQSQGYKDGYADGQEKIKAEMADQVAFFAAAAEKLARPLELLDEQVASALVDLSVRLTRRLIPEMAQRSEGYILNSLKTALEQLPVFSEGVEITVSQRDADAILRAYPEEVRKEKGWRITVSKEMADGDLQVSSRDSTVSMTLGAQIDSLIREFIRANFTEGGRS